MFLGPFDIIREIFVRNRYLPEVPERRNVRLQPVAQDFDKVLLFRPLRLLVIGKVLAKAQSEEQGFRGRDQKVDGY